MRTEKQICDHDLARLSIVDVVNRYNIAGDSHSLEAMVAVFAPDAVYESAMFHCVGTGAIRTHFSKAWGAEKDAALTRFRRHHLTTMQIDIDGPERGHGLVYYLAITDLGPDHSGFYLDQYQLVEGVWKISKREVWMEWALDHSRYVPERSKELLRETGVSGPPYAGTPMYA